MLMSFNRGIVDDFPIKCFGMSTQCANVSRPKQKQTCHLSRFFIASIVKKISLVNEPKVNFLQFYPKSTGLPGALRKSYCFSTIIKDDKREMAGKVDTSI